MPTDVVMPQMGESIFEGTITKWLKKPGEKVQRDEPLFEISTDKVDAEIPAPAAGVLKEIKVKEGATVQVNTVVGVIDESGAGSAAAANFAGTKPPQDGDPGVKQQPAVPTQAAPPAAAAPSPAGSDGGPDVDVLMPQMGESIFEGTITKWLKKVGDKVQRDEPLFEISTDKVDAEIPAPATGVLREIRAQEGSTVQVNTVVAVIGGKVIAKAETAPATKPPEAKVEPPKSKPAIEFPVPDRKPGERVHSSPLVRRLAHENDVDLSEVPGTGLGGRVTKDDILNFIEMKRSGKTGKPDDRVFIKPPTDALPKPTPPVAPPPQALTGELVPMSRIRILTAQKMVESKRTSAHVHTVFKVDMTKIVKFREKNRKAWEARNGVKLTFMPFVAKALMHGVRVKPVVNSSVVGDAIQYHKNINIGIAVALDWGLIVPVVKRAENLSFVGLQRGITDLGERARAKKLVPDEVQGGTITITNPGIFGPQFGTPIILQPQVAILGMGGIFKEPVVVTDEDGNDSIAIRSIIRLTLGYDHRIIDGADADQFMVAVRDYLEKFNEDIG